MRTIRQRPHASVRVTNVTCVDSASRKQHAQRGQQIFDLLRRWFDVIRLLLLRNLRSADKNLSSPGNYEYSASVGGLAIYGFCRSAAEDGDDNVRAANPAN